MTPADLLAWAQSPHPHDGRTWAGLNVTLADVKAAVMALARERLTAREYAEVTGQKPRSETDYERCLRVAGRASADNRESWKPLPHDPKCSCGKHPPPAPTLHLHDCDPEPPKPVTIGRLLGTEIKAGDIFKTADVSPTIAADWGLAPCPGCLEPDQCRAAGMCAAPSVMEQPKETR